MASARCWVRIVASIQCAQAIRSKRSRNMARLEAFGWRRGAWRGVTPGRAAAWILFLSAQSPCQATITSREMDFQRLFLIGALVLVLTLLYQKWLVFESETAERSAQTVTAPTSGGATGTVEVTANTTDVPSAPPAAVMESANVSTPTTLLADRAPAATSRQRVEVVTDLLRAELDTYGGDLRVLDLITYPEKLEAPDEPFRLLTDSGPDLYWAQNGLLGSQSGLPNHHSEYTATNKRYVLAEGKDHIEVPLHFESDGLYYRKVYTFHRDSYYVDVRYEVQNNTNQEW